VQWRGVPNTASHIFYTGLVERLRITAGNVGIGNNSPNNILQVGDGARLRISNGPTDFTLIGTKDIDDANNTRIVVSGHQRTGGNAGIIEYVATTPTGRHEFKINNSTVIADIDNTELSVFRKITTYGGNYHTDGETVSWNTLINTAGTSRQGFFISTQSFFNSLIMIAFSHNSFIYTYWHGRISTNNNTQIINITNYIVNQMAVESFTQQGTNINYILVYPTAAASQLDNLRVKFYS
jgi:hypothetical protein